VSPQRRRCFPAPRCGLMPFPPPECSQSESAFPHRPCRPPLPKIVSSSSAHRVERRAQLSNVYPLDSRSRGGTRRRSRASPRRHSRRIALDPSPDTRALPEAHRPEARARSRVMLSIMLSRLTFASKTTRCGSHSIGTTDECPSRRVATTVTELRLAVRRRSEQPRSKRALELLSRRESRQIAATALLVVASLLAASRLVNRVRRQRGNVGRIPLGVRVG
jgi:hypothetical protein